MAIRVAVDAMGGDRAPSVVVEGAVLAARALPEQLHVLLVGPEDQVRPVLAGYDDAATLPITVVHAPEVIGMGEAPAAAVKSKLQSSIHVGLGAQKQGQADAFVSAGNTGAVMAASLFILGRQENVARPSVPGFFPTLDGLCIVLDVGSNVDCKPEHLVQFAHMGAVYARQVMNRPDPEVALLNVGSEPGKGNEQAKAVFELLSQAPGLRFKGNIEGRDIFGHGADVVVCDGFVGNIMLKLGESMATTFVQMVEREMTREGHTPEERALVVRAIESVGRRFDYEEYGGAPLLGVNGNVVIGHGSSSGRAIERMIRVAVDLVEGNVAGSIAASLNR